MAIRRALLSVSDKAGIVDFARALNELGVDLLSTGGTAKALKEAGLPVVEVSEHTGFPEMLDGRVKTLHPRIHGGLLARRDVPEHLKAMEDHDIEPIDLVAVNLYPFRETIANPACTLEDAIENIDIGGPAMVRSAAKNYRHVVVLTDPKDYAQVLEEMSSQAGSVSFQTRFQLACKAYAHTAEYDGAIADWLSLQAQPEEAPFPPKLHLHFIKAQSLRYGENPHQQAAFYRDPTPAPGTLANWIQHQGKELSYNNIADADAAWECVRGLTTTACVIVKHANPCGVALGANTLEAYRRAFSTDPTSAFGGIIAFNHPIDSDTAEAIAGQFSEVVIAPGYTPDALSRFQSKGNVRVLEVSLAQGNNTWEFKRVGGGLLVQSPDLIQQPEFKVVTQTQPSESQMSDLKFAFHVAQFIKSNAVVFCSDGRTLGVGAGQMSRVDSTRIASRKAEDAGLSLQGSVCASDAFFPFRDGLDVIAAAGATAVIHPGGSLRDEEVIAAANEHSMAMVLTGVRHFRH
jgi:phosphoribosylaminoimidazolecarboxamide formyltransferase / IMP cyclohydrolase